MAQNKPRYVSTFRAPTEYERQLEEARRRAALAEALAQQEYQPMEGAAAPIPKAAPLVKALQGFLTAREGRLAKESAAEAEKAGRQEFTDYIRSFEPEQRTVGTGEIAAMEAPMPIINTTPGGPAPVQAGQPGFRATEYAQPSAIAAPNQRLMPAMTATGEPDFSQPMQMQVGGPLTTAQKRARALEGFESANPMVQQYAMTQFEATSPKRTELKIGDIDPAKFTPQSVRAAVNAGDYSLLVPREEAPEGTTMQKDYEYARSQGYQGSFADFRQAATPKTTVDVRYGAPVAGVNAQGEPVFFQPNPTGGPPSIISGVAPKPEAMGAGEANAALFADRAARAEPVFNQLLPPSLSATAKGGLGPVGNVLLTPENRQFFQAERNFITAVLRKESGANIPENEYNDARRVYIPQVGDDERTLEMKRQARQDAIAGIARGAGPAYKPPGSDSSKGNVSNVPTGALNSAEQKRLEELRRKRAGGG